MSWSLCIELGILFIGVCLGGTAREEGNRAAEAVAVLCHSECIGRVLHRANVLDDDAAVVNGVADEAQVGADVARTRIEHEGAEDDEARASS